MKNIEELNMEELEMVSGGNNRPDQQSDGLSDLIMLIEKWLFDW